jgi:hypothetical protein
MNKKITKLFVLGMTILLLSFSLGYGQGDNSPDPLVNLGCLDEAVLSGSVPEGEGRGIPSDILWNPATNSYLTESTWHEYGLAYNDTVGGITKENPLWWQVEWPTAKNINYITCTGPFGNQPQPHTGWAVQIWADSLNDWMDLPKAHNGWEDDSLRGIGGWVNNGLLHWRGLKPVVTTKLRLIAFANPDSLADGKESFADSLWSMVFVGRQMGASSPKACLIQYLDFSGEEADNKRVDNNVNLGLIYEAVVSASFKANELSNIRGEPTQMLFDPVKGDFHYTGSPWGEFGYPWQWDAGYLTEDDPFYWMVEWPVPKNVNYFSWGGVYGNQPQPTTPWAVQYWDGSEWVTLEDGIGGSFAEGVNGVDVDALSEWMSEEPIQTTKFRLAVWSDGIDPLFSYHLRGRGGSTLNWDQRDSVFVGAHGTKPYRAVLIQYRDLATDIEPASSNQPVTFALQQNYPNPFNPQTNIQFSLAKSGHVRLSVYNVRGQEVAVLVDENRTQGFHQEVFDASALSSGIYFYRLNTEQGILTKKMMVIK